MIKILDYKGRETYIDINKVSAITTGKFKPQDQEQYQPIYIIHVGYSTRIMINKNIEGEKIKETIVDKINNRKK